MHSTARSVASLPTIRRGAHRTRRRGATSEVLIAKLVLCLRTLPNVFTCFYLLHVLSLHCSDAAFIGGLQLLVCIRLREDPHCPKEASHPEPL